MAVRVSTREYSSRVFPLSKQHACLLADGADTHLEMALGVEVALVCIANVVISVVATCLYYRQLWALNESPAFATQLGCAIQAAICACVLGALRMLGKSPSALRRRIPMRVWVELACWFSLQNTLEIASIDGLGPENGNLVPCLQQTVIPLTLVASAMLYGRCFSRRHWFAALLVIGGVALSYMPSAITEPSRVHWGWAVVFVVSRVPQSLANVRTEAALKLDKASQPELEQDRRLEQSLALDGIFSAGFFTALLGLLLNLPSSMLLAAARGQGALSVLDDYQRGSECLFNQLNETAQTNATDAASGRCATAASAVALFALPGALFAVSEFQVIQRASAATYFLLSAFELPLQAAAVSLPFVMGSLTSTFHESLLWGLPVMVLGLVAWAHAEHMALGASGRTERARIGLNGAGADTASLLGENFAETR